MFERVVITPDPIVEDPNHAAAMAAKVDAANAAATAPAGAVTAPSRPDWLPDGFDTPEAFWANYEAMKTSKPAEEKTADEKPADQATEKPADQATAEEAVVQAGLDMEVLSDRLLTDGKLSEDDYTALAKVGVSRQIADAYIEGQRALGEMAQARMAEVVGGAENLNTLLTWAGQGNLPAADVEAFNAVVDGGNEAAIRLALTGLKATYDAKGNNAPKLLGGGRTSANTDVFESNAQLVAAMSDPKYRTDDAYRAAVVAKLDRSSLF